MKKIEKMLSVSPTMKPPPNTPKILPIPPMITAKNERARKSNPIVEMTDMIGAMRAPEIPARADPKTKLSKNIL